MLFSRYKVAYEKKRNIIRNVASVAELTKSFYAEIDKVENREALEKRQLEKQNSWNGKCASFKLSPLRRSPHSPVPRNAPFLNRIDPYLHIY